MMNRAILAPLSLLILLALKLNAATIGVPNGSFEAPAVPPGIPAIPSVDIWQKSPEPPNVPLPGGITWDQLAGVFPNTAPGASNHIDNVDGNQAAYLIAIPGVSLFQSLDSSFEVGNSYNLSIGILGGGGIAEGSSFQLSFFYMDGANPVTVASAPIIYSGTAFPNVTHLIDYSVSVPEIQAGDAWAGQNIGIQLLSTFGTGVGYWDVDNVRVAVVPEPGTIGLFLAGGTGLLILGLRARRGV